MFYYVPALFNFIMAGLIANAGVRASYAGKTGLAYSVWCLAALITDTGSPIGHC